MERKKQTNNILLHSSLFLLTLLFTSLAGAEWTTGNSFFALENSLGIKDITKGFAFSLSFLAVLTIHEFGHYFTAKWYRVKVTLPYYLPLWLGFLGWPSLGTIGAFIKLQSPVKSRNGFFDIGIAGPLAGFVAALILLWYGFTHLPPLEYLFQIHPEYAQFGTDYAENVYGNKEIPKMAVGRNLLFLFFEKYVALHPERIPNKYELFHSKT